MLTPAGKRVLAVPDGLRVLLEGEDLARGVEDLPRDGRELERALWSAGPPIEVRFAVAYLSAVISAVFQGVMRNS